MLQSLIYRSFTDLTPLDAGYQHIMARSRLRNRDLLVTGYLHWEDGIFHQWIEGPAVPLLIVEQIILSDQLHRNITILRRGEIPARQFEGWAMAASTSEEKSLFNFLAASDAGHHHHPAYAFSILQFMKQQMSRLAVNPDSRATS